MSFESPVSALLWIMFLGFIVSVADGCVVLVWWKVNELSKDEKNDVAYTMYSLFKDNIKEEKDD
jgi:hypothetical protein